MMKKAFVVSLFILILQPLSLLGADPGTRRWRTNLVRGSYGGIAIAPDGTLYTAAGELVAIAPDGSIRWNRFCGATGGRLSAPVIGADGTIYVHNDDTEDFWAVNPDGTTKWSLPVPTRWPRGLAIGADGTLYKIGWHRSKNELRALRPDGSSLWSFQTNGNVGGSPVVSSDGTILVASHVGHTNYPSTPESVLYAVNPNGEELWRYETPDTLDASPAVDRDGNIYISSSDGEIYSLDRDGNLNWQFSTGSVNAFTALVGEEGVIYVGAGDGILYALNPDGSERWTYETGGSCSGAALGSDGTIYLSAADRRLHAISPEGIQLWAYGASTGATSSFVGPPVVGSDGTVYVVGKHSYWDGTHMDAVFSSSEGLAASPWPVAGQNPQRTGRRRPVDMPPVRLDLDVPHESPLPGGELHHFTIDTQAGQNVLVGLDVHGGIERVVLDAGYGDRPDPGAGRWSSMEPTVHGRYELLVSPAEEGPLAISVLATWVSNPGSYALTVSSNDTYLSDISPRIGGNVGPVTVALSGFGFAEGMTVELDNGGSVMAATGITATSSTKLVARLNLSGATPGLYDVTARWLGGAVETLADAFTVTPGTGPRLETSLELPVATRPGRTYFGWIEYGNDGDTDMPAPLLVVTSPQDPLMRLSSSEAFSHGGLQVLGISHGHTAGVLGPGERYRIPFQFVSLVTSGINFKVDEVVNDQSAIDWPLVESEIRSPDMSDELWTSSWSNFTAMVGTTWSDYVGTLGEMATYLGRHGRQIHDVQALFGALFARAAGSYLGETLDAELDAYAPARGVPLLFSRVAPSGLGPRFTAGPLGRGWAHGYEYRLKTATNRVTIHLPGGSTRSFFLEDGSWRGGAGEHAALSDGGGGAFTLLEPAGVTLHFDVSGRLVVIDEPNGNSVTLGYTGELLGTITHSNGQSIELEYNAEDRIAYLTDHAGRVTEYVYDPTGELLESVIAPGGVTTQYAYRPDSGDARSFALESITHPDGTHTYFDYDSEGRLSATRLDGDEQTVTLDYDHLGTVTATDELGHARLLRLGAHGEVLEQQNPLGERHRFVYDERLDLRRIELPDGTAALMDYDTRGNPIAVTSPGHHTVRTASTTIPVRLDWFSDALEQTIDFDYEDGNPVAVTYPDGSLETFTYDGANGDLETATNRRSDTITVEHNGIGELTDVDHPDGTWVDLGRDDSERTWTFTDAVGTTSIDYDERGMLETVTDGAGRTVTSAVNDAGRRTRMETGDGYVLDYGYDAAGRLSTINDGDGFEIVRYSWDDVGRLGREDRGNGTSAVYAYEAADRLLSVTHHAPGGAVQSFYAYTYDLLGNPVTLTTAAGVTEYGYDGDGQLATITRPDDSVVVFTYDAAGNRELVSDDGAETEYEANELNRYTEVGGTILTWDDDGNLETKTDGGGTTTLEWNAASRLQTLSSPAAGSWTFRDDAAGNRVEVVRDGVGRHYQHDPRGLGDVIAEYDDQGGLVARSIHGLGLVARLDAAGNYVWYGFDGTGNTRQLTDASGAVVNSYDYTPFGVPTATVETLPNPFRYGGRDGVMDDGHGLYYMRARYYDPRTGRFVSPDPIGLAGGSNLYSYVANSPVRFSDPSGLVMPDPVPAVIRSGIDAVKARDNYGSSLKSYGTGATREEIQASIDAKHHAGRAYVGSSGRFVGHTAVDLYTGYAGYLGRGTAIARQVSTATGIMSEIGHGAIESRYPKPGPVLMGGNVAPPKDGLPTQTLMQAWTAVIVSFDPNEKAGPAGLGPDRVVRAGQKLDYTVYFENVPTATAAAQEVFVTDCLDRNLDWTTLEVDEVVFGDHTVTNPGGGAVFTQRVTVDDLREGDDSTWWVDVSSTIDLSSGCLDVALEMRDPETGELPMDVFAGFLPPDDGEGSGQGHFSYSIEVKEGLEDGRLVRNRAEIVFDANDAIWTNEVINMVGPQLYSLTISSDGGGAGTVTSDPAGIDCGETCVGWYAENATVRLSATPAHASLFDGWSGDPDCDDGEVALSADTVCVAEFADDSLVFSDGFENEDLRAWSAAHGG